MTQTKNRESPIGSTDLAGSALRGSVALSIQWLLNKLCTAGSTIVIAYFLSPSDYGVARTALSVVVFLALPPLVMGDVLVARSRRSDYWAGPARRLALQIATGSTILTLAAIPFVLRAINTVDPLWLGALLGVLAIRPLLQASRVVPLAKLRHDLRFRLIAVVDGTIQLASTVTSVGLAAAGAGPAAIVIPQILREAAAALLYVRVAPPVPPKRVQRTHRRALLWTYVTGASAEYVHGLVMNIPLLAVVYLAGGHQAGLFGFAFMLAIQANGIILARLGVILQPVLGRLQRQRTRQVEGFLRSTRVLAAVCVPVSLLQAILAEPVFRLLLEPKWEPATAAFQALSLAQGLYFSVAPSMACLKAQRRFRVLLVWQAIHLALSLPAYWAATALGGAAGAASVTALLWAGSAPIAVWMCVRFARPDRLLQSLSVFVKPWLRVLPLFFVGYLAIRWLSNLGTVGDVIGVAAVGPLVLGVALVVSRHTEPEFRTVVDRLIGSVKRSLLRAS